jgi:SAM-dependent methyltransferase
MNQIDSARYLRETQYKTAGNLNARASLHERFGTNPVPWHSWVLDHVRAAAGAGPKRVLEVGCGPGLLWQHNALRVPADWQLILTDFSPGMVQVARAGVATHLRASPAVADAQLLPFGRQRFELVIANHMLYHVPDCARAIAGFARVLKPGGVLVAATNGAKHLAGLDNLSREFGLANWHAAGALGFRLENGRAMLERSFQRVILIPYKNILRVTEAAPLAAYMLSSAPAVADPETLARDLEAFLQGKLRNSNGVIEIHSHSGMFVCKLPESAH